MSVGDLGTADSYAYWAGLPQVVRSSEGLSSFEFSTLTRLEEYCRQDGHGHHWVW